MNCAFAYTHSPIDFYFRHSPRDFVVEEIPLYPFSGEGAHLILKVRKKNLTTFSAYFNIKEKEIGYAGLKDKNALTIQHISLPYHLVKSKLESFSSPHIKILDSYLHNNKLKIGHLKGNNFFVRLKKLDKLNLQKITQVLKKMEIFGIPNYFGYQRFGRDGKNFLEGKEIVANTKICRSKKMRDFLISAYQSYLFNQWLSVRINLSQIIQTTPITLINKALRTYLKTDAIPLEFQDATFCQSLKSQPHFFKMLSGDCLCHYPFGKNFILEKDDDLSAESRRFLEAKTSITGLLSGVKMQTSGGVAGFFENLFIDSRIKSIGQRRYAWIFPLDINLTYKEESAHGELSFFLPKGAYATNFLREIAHREIKEENRDEESEDV